MRVVGSVRSLLVVGLLGSHFVSALSFGGNKKQQSGDDSDETTDNHTSTVRGAARSIQSDTALPGISDLSEAVSALFQTGTKDASSVAEVLRDAIQTTATSMELETFLETTRRALHKDPEVMYELPHTSRKITAILDELNIDYTTGWAKNTHPDRFPGAGGYGVVAHIGQQQSSENGPCIILRADMDALPILEATQGIESFKSQNTGTMHACGHDGHVTMLLGAAAILKKVEDQIQGTVRLVFQPAEEGGAGMKRMVEEGVVDLEPKAQLGFGMHVWPGLPSGTIAGKPGVLMAAAEMFEIVLEGKGGHAAMPHLTRDPIVAAASLVMNLQSVVSRTISPLESGVISVTKLVGGDAFNVIPQTVVVGGTIRALSTEMLLDQKAKLERMVDATVQLHDLVGSSIEYMPDWYPAASNDPELFDWSRGISDGVSAEGLTREVVPTMGGEDFAFLAQTIPSVFFFVGSGSGGDATKHLPPTDFGLHHPSFALDEHVLPTGVQLHVNLALRALHKLLHESDGEASAAEL